MKKNSILKKLTAALLTTATLASAGMGASAAVISDFKDVSSNAWYYEAVDYAVQENLFSGTGKNTFSPNGAMTRGMFVTVLGRKAGVDISKYLTCRFTDVKQGEWYTPYVEWAATSGIVSGTSATTFSPNKFVTREQMAAFLYRFAKATENDTAIDGSAYKNFPDKGSVSSYAEDALQWATGKGIINGSAGKLNPKGTATRAQVAQVFLSAKNVLTKTEITANPNEPAKPDDSQQGGFVKPTRGAWMKNGQKPTPENITAALYALKDKYPEGIVSNNCSGFARDLTLEVFDFDDDDDWAAGELVDNASFDDFQPGDILGYHNAGQQLNHVFVVLEKHDDYILAVEGNVRHGDKDEDGHLIGRVRWGYKYTREFLSSCRLEREYLNYAEY